MVIVSDTTTISNLFLINRLDILQQLYGHIILPTAVFLELEKLETMGVSIHKIKNADWIEVKSVRNPDIVLLLSEVLDSGEAVAIALARELKADLLIIDELKGRNYAKKMNIAIIGLVGILLQAKEETLIPNVKDILDELRDTAGFWLNQNLYQKAIELAARSRGPRIADPKNV